MYTTYLLVPFVLAICVYFSNMFTTGLYTSDGIPGPSIARWTKFYRVWLFTTGRGPLKYAQLHQHYGPIVRMGPNYVSITKAGLIPVVYDTRQKFRKVRVS